ncbi:WD40 repeat domain-containing protein [Haliangium sp. UPWRP_2]|uniref:WD40 repeat domain-containing protein n=1 Tax=Haliangium sp. UPWRP_2 TaxID=1931276 RepID=UPI000B5445FA|nr:WD40 repeat domain-containing protein [Haliangium sp. UPWRP_2]PSM32187.1 hypothetical protein BVG81_001560 [Haliangium sp. UPWRP_2]
MSSIPSNSTLRRFIAEVLTEDSDLEAVCRDSFPEVAQRFAGGQDRIAKVNLLLAYASTATIVAGIQAYSPERARRFAHLLAAQPVPSGNPYRGLAAFQVDEAHLFFGRKALTEKLWLSYQTVHESQTATRLVTILGPSGSGKSSVARAGLLATLETRPLPGRQAPRRVLLKPGQHPLRALALSLLQFLAGAAALPDVGAQRKLGAELSQPNRLGEYDGLTLWSAGLPSVLDAPLVLLVDQFEEIYTLCTDKTERDAFVGLLLHAANDRARHVSVVLTLRSDFLGETQQQHRDLNIVIVEQCVLVGAMNQEELRQAIAKPAENTGHPIDEATIALLLNQTRDRAGALPLLEFSLTQIWAGMQANKPPGVTLQEIGGVGGALADKAQQIYGALSEQQKAVARRALVRLVQFGEGTGDTRRRRPVTELCGSGETVADLLSVLRRFSTDDARLVTLLCSAAETEAELTHEALVEHWGEMQRWLVDGRADRRLHDRAAEAAKLWQEAGRPAGRLWRTPDLDLLREYRRRNPDDLNPVQAAFLNASKHEHQRGQLFRLGVAVTLLGALFGTAGIYITKERQRTAEERRRVQVERRLVWDSKMAAAQLEKQLMRSYVERGRQLLVNEGSPLHAALWLHRAQRAGVVDSPLPELLRTAMEAVDRTNVVLVGHQDAVYSAKYSPDGRRLLTAGADKIARIWDAETGRLHVALSGHTGSIFSTNYSPDGQLVVTAGKDTTARLWDAATGQIRFELTGHSGPVSMATFSPDGRRVVTASWDKTVRIWDVALGKPLFVLRGHREDTFSALFSRDGRRLITAGLDKEAILWDGLTGKVLRRFKGHQQRLYSAEFSPDGQHIVTASTDRTARIWDADTGKCVAELVGHSDGLNGASYSPDGQHIVTYSPDKTARVWQASNGRLVVELKGHRSSVVSAAYSTDSHRILTTSEDGTARLWDAKTGHLLADLYGHTATVWGASFSPDGRSIVSASADHTARTWSPQTTKVLKVLKERQAKAAEYSHDGGRIVVVGSDQQVRLWEVESGRLLGEFKGHPAAVYSATFSPDGKYILTASADGTARVWGAEKQQQFMLLAGHQGAVRSARYSPDGVHIVTVGDDATARIWDARTGSSLGILQVNSDLLWNVNFSPDSRHIIVVGSPQNASIWDLSTKRCIAELKGHSRTVVSGAYSHDGRFVLTGSWDNSARVWDAITGGLVRELKGHTDSIERAIFRKDGTLIVTASADKTIKIWDTKSGLILSEYREIPDRINTLMYDPTGMRLLTASEDGLARIWDLSPETRSSDQIGRRLRCLVPLDFEPADGDTLVPTMPKPSECQAAGFPIAMPKGGHAPTLLPRR